MKPRVLSDKIHSQQSFKIHTSERTNLVSRIYTNQSKSKDNEIFGSDYDLWCFSFFYKIDIYYYI